MFSHSVYIECQKLTLYIKPMMEIILWQMIHSNYKLFIPLIKELSNYVDYQFRYNDLSFITGRDQVNKLRKEPTESSDATYESAHVSLIKIKKKYD